MPEQKERNLKMPGEANRDKHINFSAEQQSDADPASEDRDDNDTAVRTSAAGVRGGFYNRHQ